MRYLKWFLAIVAAIGTFELLLWIHGSLLLNIPVDFTGVTTLTIWAAVLTVVFMVFAVLGLLNIDSRIKELADLKDKVTETSHQMEAKLQEIQSLADKERNKIVKSAEEEIIKIMDKSAKRQNLFDRLTQIHNMMDLVSQIKNYTEILKNNSELDGMNVCFILCRRGEAYQALKRDEEAERDFKAAIERDPKSPEGYITLGYFLVMRKKDYEGSIEYFKKALELDPTQAAMYTNVANSYAKLGNALLADEYYSKARDYNVDAAEWYYNKAITLRNSGTPDANHEIEEGYLRHALRLNPMFFRASINLARIQQERKEFVPAIENLHELISFGLNDEYFKAVFQVGNTFLQMNYPSIALHFFQWTFQQQPFEVELISNIVFCNCQKGDMSTAAQYADWGLKVAAKTNNHSFDDVFKNIVADFKHAQQCFISAMQSKTRT